MKRIYNKSNLVKGNTYHLEEKYYIHLIKVMRLNIGEHISLFNEENGEWLAKIIEVKKNSLIAEVLEQTLPPKFTPNINLLFSPIKHLNSESIIRQSTEMGIKNLYPTKFQRTVKGGKNKLLNCLIHVKNSSSKISKFSCLCKNVNVVGTNVKFVYVRCGDKFTHIFYVYVVVGQCPNIFLPYRPVLLLRPFNDLNFALQRLKG